MKKQFLISISLLSTISGPVVSESEYYFMAHTKSPMPLSLNEKRQAWVSWFNTECGAPIADISEFTDGGLFGSCFNPSTSMPNYPIFSSINSSIMFRNLPAGFNINGLRGVTNIAMLYFRDGTIESLEPLSDVIQTSSSVFIRGITNLENLDGLRSLQSAGNISLINNISLLNVDGLSSLTTANTLQISSNPLLENLDGLIGLTSVNGDVRVDFGNTNLDDISGLQNLSSASEIYFQDKVYSVKMPQMSPFCQSSIPIYGPAKSSVCEGF